jgi:hypothetical protein
MDSAQISCKKCDSCWPLSKGYCGAHKSTYKTTNSLRWGSFNVKTTTKSKGSGGVSRFSSSVSDGSSIYNEDKAERGLPRPTSQRKWRTNFIRWAIRRTTRRQYSTESTSNRGAMGLPESPYSKMALCHHIVSCWASPDLFKLSQVVAAGKRYSPTPFIRTRIPSLRRHAELSSSLNAEQEQLETDYHHSFPMGGP